MVVTVMRGVLTRAEQSLIDLRGPDAVHEMRHRFQQTMEIDFREAIERLTGRSVIAFISGNDVDSDFAAEMLILDEPL